MKPHTFFYLSLFAVIFISAKKRVMARIYNIGDIKVVEFVILLRAELTCSQASLFASFKSWNQRSTRVTFSTSRREWEFFLFNLALRQDENFLTLNLGLWHEIKKKSSLISVIETRSRFISSVRSSYSHPDLLLIHHPTTHFFRSHRSSTLDFRFLSNYSYIKAINAI